jgi:hypothetical protein
MPGDLEPEVERILVELVEANETVDRAHRTFFALHSYQASGVEVQEGGLDRVYEVAAPDLRELDDAGLIRRHTFNTRGTFQFEVTREGREYVETIRQRGQPLEGVEAAVDSYLEAEEFRARHAEAYAKWRQAQAYLAADPFDHATRIGHDCREAILAFAASLAASHGVQAQEKGTYAAIKAVIDQRRDELGERTHVLLDALFALWKAASGVAQRQEHGSQREDALDADDARRCVFYTGLVMYELDRTLG